MYQIDFQHPCRIHFIGIGGISMSGLALVLLREGFQVSGSDSRDSDLIQLLISRGAAIAFPQKAENIPEGTDVVVYTAAIHPDNPEFSAAKERKIPMLTRAELLGQIMDHYPSSIAVAGTHGKTTTTSMISCIFLSAGLDPTISVGGILQEIGGNIRLGQSENFIAEACEYTNSFLSLRPKTAVILNIDADHLDFFKDLEDIRRSFHRFAENIQDGGVLIINGSIENIPEITEGIRARIVTYGSEGSDYVPTNISYDGIGAGSFDLLKKQEDGSYEKLGSFSLTIPGEHNVSNAAAAIAAADLSGISMDRVREGLLRFHGADRRFERKGLYKGAQIVDDYAHHPTEILATLKAAKHFPHKKIWCVFQPHTYTRTKALLPEFASALALADEVVLADIYAARETDNLGISSDTLRGEIEKLGAKAVYFPSFSEIEDYLRQNLKEGDLCLVMGAGDVIRVGQDLLS